MSDIEVYSKSELDCRLPLTLFTIPISPSLSTLRTRCTFVQRHLPVRFDLAARRATLATLTAAYYTSWEFITTLGFEWEVFTGRRPWKWSFVVYLVARLLALMSVILNLIGFNLTTEFNCNVSGHSILPRLVPAMLILCRPGFEVRSFRRGSPLQLRRSFLCFVGT